MAREKTEITFIMEVTFVNCVENINYFAWAGRKSSCDFVYCQYVTNGTCRLG